MIVEYTDVRRAKVCAWKEKEDDPESLQELREGLKLQKKNELIWYKLNKKEYMIQIVVWAKDLELDHSGSWVTGF